MPDLNLKLETLVAGAAECELVGNLASDVATRTAYRRRADELRALAERVRTQIERPRTDFEFLLQQAGHCRTLAATMADDALKSDLLTFADELARTVDRERGVS